MASGDASHILEKPMFFLGSDESHSEDCGSHSERNTPEIQSRGCQSNENTVDFTTECSVARDLTTSSFSFLEPDRRANNSCPDVSGRNQSQSSQNHAVMRTSEAAHLSAISWNGIDELLDDDIWCQLRQVTEDIKKCADILLSECQSFSISFQVLAMLSVIFDVLVKCKDQTSSFVVAEEVAASQDSKKSNSAANEHDAQFKRSSVSSLAPNSDTVVSVSLGSRTPQQRSFPSDFRRYDKRMSSINVSHFHNLVSLTLKDVPLSAIKGIEHIRGRRLKSLVLRRVSVTKLSHITNLSSQDLRCAWKDLTEADFSCNNFVSIDSSITCFSNLQSLLLTHCGLTNAPGLSELTAPLQYLDLSHNRLTSLPIFTSACCSSLLSLRVCSNDIVKLNGVQMLESLQHLELQHNLLALPGSLAPLGALTELCSLRITGNPVSTYKESRALVLSRLHPKVALNKFHLDELPLSQHERSLLGTQNWVFDLSHPTDPLSLTPLSPYTPCIDSEKSPHARKTSDYTSPATEKTLYASNSVSSQSPTENKTVQGVFVMDSSSQNSPNTEQKAPQMLSPESMLRLQLAGQLETAVDRQLLPALPASDGQLRNDLNVNGGARRKKRRSSKRTRVVEIVEPEEEDEHLPSSNLNLPSPDSLLEISSVSVDDSAVCDANPGSNYSLDFLRASGGVLPHQLYIEDLLLRAASKGSLSAHAGQQSEPQPSDGALIARRDDRSIETSVVSPRIPTPTALSATKNVSLPSSRLASEVCESSGVEHSCHRLSTSNHRLEVTADVMQPQPESSVTPEAGSEQRRECSYCLLGEPNRFQTNVADESKSSNQCTEISGRMTLAHPAKCSIHSVHFETDSPSCRCCLINDGLSTAVVTHTSCSVFDNCADRQLLEVETGLNDAGNRVDLSCRGVSEAVTSGGGATHPRFPFGGPQDDFNSSSSSHSCSVASCSDVVFDGSPDSLTTRLGIFRRRSPLNANRCSLQHDNTYKRLSWGLRRGSSASEFDRRSCSEDEEVDCRCQDDCNCQDDCRCQYDCNCQDDYKCHDACRCDDEYRRHDACRCLDDCKCQIDCRREDDYRFLDGSNP